MATLNGTVGKKSTGNVANFKKADAFANMEVEMEAGKWVQFAGAPMFEDKALQKAVMDAGIENLNIRIVINKVVDKTSDDFSFAKRA